MGPSFSAVSLTCTNHSPTYFLIKLHIYPHPYRWILHLLTKSHTIGILPHSYVTFIGFFVIQKYVQVHLYYISLSIFL